jgi:hypothetical protein
VFLLSGIGSIVCALVISSEIAFLMDDDSFFFRFLPDMVRQLVSAFRAEP